LGFFALLEAAISNVLKPELPYFIRYSLRKLSRMPLFSSFRIDRGEFFELKRFDVLTDFLLLFSRRISIA